VTDQEPTLRERAIEGLVARGRAKKDSLNQWQRAAADDEARAFYGPVVDYVLALLTDEAAVERAYREGHMDGRSGGTRGTENQDWNDSNARAALHAAYGEPK
jgi:hypothetical protein